MEISRFGLPLLTREMLQQASRRSTYIIRMAAAAGLTVVALIVLAEQWWRHGRFQNPFALLGSGRDLLEAVVYTLFTGIYGLLPLLSCGAITDERERNSLDLLLLTKLGPWTIICEKMLSRLLLMTTLVLLSLPILAFAYSLGGVDDNVLPGTVWLLFLASFHVIAISILASTLCRSTIAAYLLTCVMGFLIILAPPLIEEAGIMGIRHEERMFPPAIFDGLSWRGKFALGDVFEVSLPLVLVSLGAVGLSRFYLTRPVPLAGAGRARWILEKLDVLLCWLLSHVRRSPQTLTTGRSLAVDRPLLWKETFSGTLSNVRHRHYVTVGVTLFVLLGCWWVAEQGRHAVDELALVYFVTTGFIAMAVVARSATLFSSERSRQTLDILLTTPMSNDQLLREKFGGINRLIALFAVPLLVLFVSDALIKEFLWTDWFNRRWRVGPDYDFSFWLYLISQIVTVGIYLQMLAWLSVLIGLKVKKPIAAMVTSLAAIMAWALVPLILTILLVEFSGASPRKGAAMLLLTSPFPYLLLNQVGELREMAASPPVLFVLNSLIYGGAMLCLRALCFRKVGKLLQREDSVV
ncbi:ABC transporter permease subunit [bacterium]|nr:ABC transporter permease subunit [bacterium]